MEGKENGDTASDFIPVETILKVDEEEVLVTQNNMNGQKLSEESSPTVSPSFISTGTQCPPIENEWKTETNDEKVNDMTPGLGRNLSKETNVNGNEVLVNHMEEESLLVKPWALQADQNTCQDQKLCLTAGFSQQFACNIQSFPADEKFFLQFDYKTRNKLKTKQRRLDPFYRNQERIRQRTVMRIKRQDPRFRAIEREKGRYRMRIKRLDPIFRSQERERQRERMKLKRRDPNFREREREQQKNRLHIKRLNPRFKEKEKAQDRLRMRIKRHNNGTFSTHINAEKNKHNAKNATDCMTGGSQVCFKSCSSNYETRNEIPTAVQHQNTPAEMLPEHLNTMKPVPLKDRDIGMDSLNYRRAHVLNFNFYNSGKEHWPNQAELCAKGGAHFNCVKEDIRLIHNHFTAATNDNFLDSKEHIERSKPAPLKDMSCRPELTNTKQSGALPSDMQTVGERHSVSLLTNSSGVNDSSKFAATAPNFPPPPSGQEPSFPIMSCSTVHSNDNAAGNYIGAPQLNPAHQIFALHAEFCSCNECTNSSIDRHCRSETCFRRNYLCSENDAIPVNHPRPEFMHTEKCLPSVQKQNKSHRQAIRLKSIDKDSSFHLVLKCTSCGKVYSDKGNYLRHSKLHFEKFDCQLCGKIFRMKQHLKEHMRSHGDKNLSCPFCDYKTCYKYALNRHISTKHGDNNNCHKCSCNLQFKTKRLLERHQIRCKIIHQNIPPPVTSISL